MKHWHSLLGILLALCLISAVGGCSQINLGKKHAAGGGGQQGNVPQVTGDWEMAFLFGEQTIKATMRLQQQGETFAGEGADQPSGREFAVQDGQVGADGQVFFKKIYPGADASMPP